MTRSSCPHHLSSAGTTRRGSLGRLVALSVAAMLPPGLWPSRAVAADAAAAMQPLPLDAFAEPPRMSQNDGECYDCYVRLAAPGWMRLAPTIYTDFNGDWTEAEVNAFDAIRDGRARPPAI